MNKKEIEKKKEIIIKKEIEKMNRKGKEKENQKGKNRKNEQERKTKKGKKEKNGRTSSLNFRKSEDRETGCSPGRAAGASSISAQLFHERRPQADTMPGRQRKSLRLQARSAAAAVAAVKEELDGDEHPAIPSAPNGDPWRYTHGALKAETGEVESKPDIFAIAGECSHPAGTSLPSFPVAKTGAGGCRARTGFSGLKLHCEQILNIKLNGLLVQFIND
jgi:hypothetical protein